MGCSIAATFKEFGNYGRGGGRNVRFATIIYDDGDAMGGQPVGIGTVQPGASASDDRNAAVGIFRTVQYSRFSRP